MILPLWMKILMAIGLVGIIGLMLLKSKKMLKETRKGTPREWLAFLFPLVFVAGFVLLLIAIT